MDYLALPVGYEYGAAGLYLLLSQAQQQVYSYLAARCPNAFFSAPTALSTADNKVFTFASSAFPIGHVEIFPSLSAVPDAPWQEGIDFLNEGAQIRIPNDRTYGNTLYGRYIVAPANIDATHDPTLLPKQARELIVYKAAELYASRGATRTEMKAIASVDYTAALSRWLLVLRTQYDGQGNSARQYLPWWYNSPDLGNRMST